MIAIDPGVSGGLAYIDTDNIVQAVAMPQGMTEQIDLIRTLSRYSPSCMAIIENVGFHMPGNSAVATAKFARHVGHLEAGCYAAGIAVKYVAPQTWMKAVLGKTIKDKRERKNAIKELMARRFPHIDVTLKTADALGMMAYYLDNKLVK